MQSRVFATVLAGLMVAGCMVSRVAPVGPDSSVQQLAASRTNRLQRPEDGVDIASLKRTMAILAGTSALPSGTLINERGGTAGRELTRQFLINSLQELGYTVERHKYRTNGENIVARLMAPTQTDEYILMGAHMDSVSNHGADDDGSGSTAVLEAARVLKAMPDRKVNLMVAWFDEEELGLVGSKYLAKEYKKQGLNITSVHCIDMLGYDNDGDRRVEVARPEGDLWETYQHVNETHGLKLPLSRVNTGSSDHVSWANEGFKSVLLCEEWNGGDTTPHYHRKTDTYETINFDFLAAGTKLMTAVVADLSQKVKGAAPQPFVPHTRFPGKDLHCH
ncbi:MAG: M28 family peptidase [Candidatus Sericytochromatia bacterium]|nr:M28 family peptidase [Candidatus Sericytochromatia bacterium]